MGNFSDLALLSAGTMFDWSSSAERNAQSRLQPILWGEEAMTMIDNERSFNDQGTS